ncbi:MAG: glycosyltransferase family 2 protein [Candidatus Omnitrophica bacterium]|nr:glycosyltransferase family 2 protein [Candidatus Omnitrophota bacterium]
MNENIYLSIVIPARNEQDNISTTIDNLLSHIDIDHTEIIVVDDHSTDRTAEIVNETFKNNPAVKLVKNLDEPGFANALKTGFSQAKGQFVLPVMADGCDDPKTIPIMLEKSKQGYDLVCGCRYMKGGKKSGGPFLQGFFSRFVCLSLYHLSGIPTRDISNAFKLYRRNVLQKIPLKEKGFAISMEAALKFYFGNYKICDVPTKWYGRKKGKSKFKLSKTLPYIKLYFLTLRKKWKKLICPL